MARASPSLPNAQAARQRTSRFPSFKQAINGSTARRSPSWPSDQTTSSRPGHDSSFKQTISGSTARASPKSPNAAAAGQGQRWFRSRSFKQATSGSKARLSFTKPSAWAAILRTVDYQGVLSVECGTEQQAVDSLAHLNAVLAA